MKSYLITLAWMMIWTFWAISITSCISIPPPTPSGDGAFQQLGLVNVTQHSTREPSQSDRKPTSITITIPGN